MTSTLKSKLPEFGTTIFSQMSELAQRHQAINLSQGFPNFDGPELLQERLNWHMRQGSNQYAPMAGMPTLLEAISDKTKACYGYRPDPSQQITVTTGATEALFAAITALVDEGDEVLCFDPSYDCYAPAITLAKGRLIRIPLAPPAFKPDWLQFAQHITEKTRLVIINTPHNPTATTWQVDDLEQLWRAIQQQEIYVLSDEVYEHICFAPQQHQSVLTHPELRERSIAVSSFGKTFHITGWKIGYCIAPSALTTELRKIHQYLTFSVNTPGQLALADILREEPEHYRQLPTFYQTRRDILVNALQNSRFKLLPCSGTYFLILDYSDISDLDDVSFCRWLTIEVGVAAIPLSVFCQGEFPHRLIRLCFAKRPETLLTAAERLCQI